MRGYYPGEREYRRGPQPRIRRPRIPDPRGRTLHLPKPRLRRRRAATAGAAAAGSAATGRRVDWVVGILLGIVLGISVVVAFLVFGSEGTIDAPASTASTERPAAGPVRGRAEPIAE